MTSLRGLRYVVGVCVVAISIGCNNADEAADSVGRVCAFGVVTGVETIIPSSGDGYDLFRASHLDVLGDGRIAVLNSGSQEILIFSPSGILVTRYGRSGQGPGEFVRPGFLSTLPGDSILVTDLDLPHRAVVFSSSGSVERTFTFETPQIGSFYIGPVGVVGRTLVAIQAQEPVEPNSIAGMRYIPVRIFVYDLDGSLLVDFEVDGVANEFFLFNLDGQLRFTTPALRRRGLVAAGLSGIIAGATDSRDVLVIAADGSVTSRLHVAPTGPELASIPIDSIRKDWAGSASTDAAKQLRAQLLPDIPYPGAAPAIAALHVDVMGRRWVGRAGIHGQPDGGWLVYSGDTLLGSIEIPHDLDVVAITATEVFGIRTNDLGEESVVRVTFREN